jgi:hypothetical protein
MPENTVYVGRPTIWGNPYRVSRYVPPEMAVDAYKRLLDSPFGRNHLATIRPLLIKELAGKDLACWCPLDQPCHADILLEIANEPIQKNTGDS